MPAASRQCQGSFTFIKHQHRAHTRAETAAGSKVPVKSKCTPPASGAGERGPGPSASDKNCPGKGTKPPVTHSWGSTPTSQPLLSLASTAHVPPVPSGPGSAAHIHCWWNHPQGWAAMGTVTQSTLHAPAQADQHGGSRMVPAMGGAG